MTMVATQTAYTSQASTVHQAILRASPVLPQASSQKQYRASVLSILTLYIGTPRLGEAAYLQRAAERKRKGWDSVELDSNEGIYPHSWKVIKENIFIKISHPEIITCTRPLSCHTPTWQRDHESKLLASLPTRALVPSSGFHSHDLIYTYLSPKCLTFKCHSYMNCRGRGVGGGGQGFSL